MGEEVKVPRGRRRSSKRMKSIGMKKPKKFKKLQAKRGKVIKSPSQNKIKSQFIMVWSFAPVNEQMSPAKKASLFIYFVHILTK